VGTSGAASIACRAAGAAGAGRVRLRARPDAWPVLAARLEAELVAPIGGVDAELAVADDSDAVLAGPGWGSGDPAPAILAGLWSRAVPLVLDADALAPLGSTAYGARSGPVALTPHPGELARLAGLSAGEALRDPLAAAARLAARLRAVVSLRAATTWVVAPDGAVLVVDGLEPALGTAGSGDAHAGLLAGLVARAAAGDRGRLDIFHLAGAAALAHAAAGRALAARRGFFSAAELPAALAAIVHAASTRQGLEPKERP
jgi:NAD(P)H-hydrate epimerase